MADVIGTSLALTDTVLDAPDRALNEASSTATLEVNGTTFVYVAGGSPSGIQALTLDEDGTLTPVGLIADAPFFPLANISAIKAFEAHGTPYIVASSRTEDGLVLLELTDSPPYFIESDTAEQRFEPSANLNNPQDIEVVETATGTVMVYVSSFSSNGISGFEVTSGGALNNVVNIDDDNSGVNNLLGSVEDMFTFRDGSSQYLAVMSAFDPGLTTFFVPNNGVLIPSGDIASSTFAGGVGDGAGIMIDGTFHFYVATGSAGLTRFEYVPGLQETSTFSSPATLDGISDVQIFEVGNRTLLFANAETSDSFNLYEIDTTPGSPTAGDLTLLSTTSNNNGQGLLNGASHATVATVGGQQFLLVTSSVSDALNAYEFGGGDDVLTGTSFFDVIKGGSGDDVITGLAAGDDLYGEAGDDLIYGGSGYDFIWGGAGDDVIYAGEGNDRIQGEFGSDIIYAGSGSDFVTVSFGQDQLFGGGGTDRVQVETGYFDAGLTIDLLREQIILPNGDIQSVVDFETVSASDQDDIVIGDDGNNFLAAGLGDDLVRGRGGDDFLTGNEGDDRLIGAGGNDDVNGGDGNDLLTGGKGDDLMFGQDGNDRIFGGADADEIRGGQGADRVRGNDGDDLIIGGDGKDELFGDAGDDVLIGGLGSDLMVGGSGRDTLVAGSGADTMTGGSAADIFTFLPSMGSAAKTVTDFKDGIDRIDLLEYNFANIADVLATGSQSGSSVLFEFAAFQRVIIENAQLTDFAADNFIL